MNAITREEQLLQSISDGTSSGLSPITREEQYLSFIAGETIGYPQQPITRKEQFLEKIAQGGISGGGASVNVQPLNVSKNGTYSAPSGMAYSPVKVNVEGQPLNITSATEMNAILSNATDADLGKVYYYTGASTDTYEQGALYMITKEE